MLDLAEAIAAMTPEQRKGATIALDAMTRPLTAREIERALLSRGVPRSRAVIVSSSIKSLAIIAVLGGEDG